MSDSETETKPTSASEAVAASITGNLLSEWDWTSMWPLLVLGGLLLILFIVKYMENVRAEIEVVKHQNDQFLTQTMVMSMLHQMQVDTLTRVKQAFAAAVNRGEFNEKPGQLDPNLVGLVVHYNEELDKQIYMIQSNQDKQVKKQDLDF